MNIIISNSSPDLIYEQISKQLRHLILNGDLQGGGLPSIRSLAKELQISVITTKRAYEELEKEGYIEMRQLLEKGRMFLCKIMSSYENKGCDCWKVKLKK